MKQFCVKVVPLKGRQTKSLELVHKGGAVMTLGDTLGAFQ